MNTRKVVAILIVTLFFAASSICNAALTLSVDVINVQGESIAGSTVSIGTLVNVTSLYQNTNGYKANATIDLYFSVDNKTFFLKARLFNGIVSSGQTVNVGPFMLTDIGYYEFRWTCTEILNSVPTSTLGGCNYGVGKVRTYLNNVIPEPAPVIGVLMAILALGFFAVKKSRKTI